MIFSNIDKNLIGNIVIIISIVLVIICIFMIVTSNVTNLSGSQVEWNGYLYYLDGDTNVEVNTNDTLKISSPYATHNFELKKTKDQNNFKKQLGSSLESFSENEYNATHTYLNGFKGYAAIVPTDAYELKTNSNGSSYYVLKDNTEFIEVTGDDSMYMESVTSNPQKVK